MPRSTAARIPAVDSPLPSTLNPIWYGATVLPLLHALPELALFPPDRRACDELYALLITLADDLRSISEGLPEEEQTALRDPRGAQSG